MSTSTAVVQVHGPASKAADEILTDDALRLVGLLCAKFEGRRQALLEARKCRAKKFDAGEVPTFLPPSPSTQDQTWKCAPIPSDIQDRRVEITGPVDRKMVRWTIQHCSAWSQRYKNIKNPKRYNRN